MSTTSCTKFVVIYQIKQNVALIHGVPPPSIFRNVIFNKTYNRNLNKRVGI